MGVACPLPIATLPKRLISRPRKSCSALHMTKSVKAMAEADTAKIAAVTRQRDQQLAFLPAPRAREFAA